MIVNEGQQKKETMKKALIAVEFGLLIVLVAMLVSGIPSTSYAGGLLFPPQDETTMPVYHILLGVHLGRSSLRASAFTEVLKEINHIWRSQAGICFDMQVVMNDDMQSSGFDIWFVPRIDNSDSLNGDFGGGHSITVRDTPILNAASRPAQYAAARTAAHELGHALGLSHRQDSDDNLMRSKTYGWQLNREEIAAARKAAAARAIRNNAASTCSTVRIKP
jgi:hypothetical protein